MAESAPQDGQGAMAWSLSGDGGAGREAMVWNSEEVGEGIGDGATQMLRARW